MPQGGFIPPEEVQCHLGPPGGLLSGAEQNQLKDGSVKIPEVLQKYMGGMEVLTKKSNPSPFPSGEEILLKIKEKEKQ